MDKNHQNNSKRNNTNENIVFGASNSGLGWGWVISGFIIIAGAAFCFGKSYEKSKHHKEIRKMKKTVKDLSEKINNNK